MNGWGCRSRFSILGGGWCFGVTLCGVCLEDSVYFVCWVCGFLGLFYSVGLRLMAGFGVCLCLCSCSLAVGLAFVAGGEVQIVVFYSVYFGDYEFCNVVGDAVF